MKTINVDYLARVEGEGGLTIKFKGDEVRSVELRIFEPPRLFEAFLRGRPQLEVPDITARICGICPVAYQMSSCQAIERALGVRVEGVLRELRRLLYCGEWIESHTLHVFMLHAPDFLGYPDIVAMARDHREHVERGLRIKKAGNTLLEKLGGRAIHPVNVRVGGFFRAPEKRELAALLPELVWARDAIVEEARWLAGLSYPDFERDYEFVAMKHPTEYAILDGRITSSRGVDIDCADWETTFEEYQVKHSTALQCRVKGRGEYLAGPLARFNLSSEQLSPRAKELARELGLRAPVRNPFKGILVRAVEVCHVFEEAIAIIEKYERPARSFEEVPRREATGWGVTEAPRGLLYHRYRLAADGTVAEAKIVPPTSQNQSCIEGDLRAIAPRLIAIPHADATHLAEHAVRNYDPCISCSTHFLRLVREEVP
ncbi:MAG: Ni/Fe hydrogenase subunit alpha [Planctomycetota bacterium]